MTKINGECSYVEHSKQKVIDGYYNFMDNLKDFHIYGYHVKINNRIYRRNPHSCYAHYLTKNNEWCESASVYNSHLIDKKDE